MFASRRRHSIWALVTAVQTFALPIFSGPERFGKAIFWPVDRSSPSTSDPAQANGERAGKRRICGEPRVRIFIAVCQVCWTAADARHPSFYGKPFRNEFQ